MAPARFTYALRAEAISVVSVSTYALWGGKFKQL